MDKRCFSCYTPKSVELSKKIKERVKSSKDKNKSEMVTYYYCKWCKCYTVEECTSCQELLSIECKKCKKLNIHFCKECNSQRPTNCHTCFYKIKYLCKDCSGSQRMTCNC